MHALHTHTQTYMHILYSHTRAHTLHSRTQTHTLIKGLFHDLIALLHKKPMKLLVFSPQQPPKPEGIRVEDIKLLGRAINSKIIFKSAILSRVLLFR